LSQYGRSNPAKQGKKRQKQTKTPQKQKKIVENAVFALTLPISKSHCNERRGL